MDNLTHSLVGAVIGEAGLKRTTGLAMPTLIIAANLPDLDALGTFAPSFSLAWRRGWTHGPIALLVLPVLLTAMMIVFDRWQTRRGTRPATRMAVQPKWLLALACVGVLSHPLLDYLNTYGIRLLMPFSERWFYGDTLFIVDAWVLLLLVAGLWQSRRKGKAPRVQVASALMALVLITTYVLAMALAGKAAEDAVAAALRDKAQQAPQEIVASPSLWNPFHRDVAYRRGDEYGFAEVALAPRLRIDFGGDSVPVNMADDAVRLAANQSSDVAGFLYWARMPYAHIRRQPGETIVVLRDARYRKVPGEAGFILTYTLR